MTNRDRNILDMTTTKGGNVSWTPEAECIAKINTQISGEVSITMNEQTAKSEAAIQIVPNGDGTCTFTLPNFTLKGETPDDDDLAIGDIVVDNVTINQKDGANYYEGTVNKLELLEGFIKAHVSLSGTVENMKIDVIWLRGNEDDLSDPDHLPIY